MTNQRGLLRNIFTPITFQVIAIWKPNPTSPVERILGLWLLYPDGSAHYKDVKWVIEAIRQGHIFKVTRNGFSVEVIIRPSRAPGLPPFVATRADDTTQDNLLSLESWPAPTGLINSAMYG